MTPVLPAVDVPATGPGPAVLAAMLLVAAAVLLATPDRRTATGSPPPADGDAPAVGPTGCGTAARGRRAALRGRAAALTGRHGDGSADEEVLVLDGLAAALEAGLPTEHALALVLADLTGPGRGRSWDELRRAAGDGQPLPQVWARAARRTGSPTLHATSRAWAVAATTGAPLAAAVRTSARAARERRRLHRSVDVATAGAQATARVLTFLPVAGVGLAWLLGIGPVELYRHPLSAAAAGAGVLLLVVGRLLVGRLVATVVRRVL